MIAAAVIVALTALVIAVAYEIHGNRVLRSRTKRRVLVTTDAGIWFSGVLVAHDRRSVVLRQVQTETENEAVAAVDGEVLILTDDIAHIQFP